FRHLVEGSRIPYIARSGLDLASFEKHFRKGEQSVGARIALAVSFVSFTSLVQKFQTAFIVARSCVAKARICQAFRDAKTSSNGGVDLDRLPRHSDAILVAAQHEHSERHARRGA